MLATERDAKTNWWCPFSQVRFFGNPTLPAAAATMNRIRPGTRWLRWKNLFYRTFFPRLHWHMRPSISAAGGARAARGDGKMG